VPSTAPALQANARDLIDDDLVKEATGVHGLSSIITMVTLDGDADDELRFLLLLMTKTGSVELLILSHNTTTTTTTTTPIDGGSSSSNKKLAAAKRFFPSTTHSYFFYFLDVFGKVWKVGEGGVEKVVVEVPSGTKDVVVVEKSSCGDMVAAVAIVEEGNSSTTTIYPPQYNHHYLYYYCSGSGWKKVVEVPPLSASLRFSADGTTAAFIVYLCHNPEEGERGEIYSVNINTSQLQQLTHGSGRIDAIDITAEGSNVIATTNFSTNKPITTTPLLWLIATDGSGSKQQLLPQLPPGGYFDNIATTTTTTTTAAVTTTTTTTTATDGDGGDSGTATTTTTTIFATRVVGVVPTTYVVVVGDSSGGDSGVISSSQLPLPLSRDSPTPTTITTTTTNGSGSGCGSGSSSYSYVSEGATSLPFVTFNTSTTTITNTDSGGGDGSSSGSSGGGGGGGKYALPHSEKFGEDIFGARILKVNVSGDSRDSGGGGSADSSSSTTTTIDAMVFWCKKNYSTTTTPLLLHLHGGPAAATRFQYRLAAAHTRYPYRALLLSGYVIVVPQYRGGFGYGDDFSGANINHQGDIDIDDIVAVVDAVKKSGVIGVDVKVGVFGGSYGGYLTNKIISKFPKMFAAAVSEYGFLKVREMTVEGGDLTWENEYNGATTTWPIPKSYAATECFDDMHRVVTPTLFTCGENDDICPLSQSKQAYHILKINGIATGLVTYAGERHGYNQTAHRTDRCARIVLWFNEHMK